MRSPLRSPALVLSLLLAPLPVGAAPAGEIEREFRYEPGRIQLATKDGQTLVEMSGAAREFTPGRPDLPLLHEMIELPDGVRVAGVEVLSLETEVLSPSARVPAALLARPGIQPLLRTEPDAAVYGRVGFPPVSSQAELGYQGWMRGRHLAFLRVNPVRWDPASGRLERVARLRVRLQLEAHQDPDRLPRERIVPEWEGATASAASPAPGGRRQAEPFVPTQIPSVLGSPVAYVIVTDDALVSEFQRLADWKTESGVPAVVRTMSFIRSQYPFGADDADRLRRFIRDAYSRWGTKWVLLGGDTEIVPFRMIYTTFFGGEHIPCDMYFSCLDGNWNADGDSTYGEGYLSASNPGDNCDLLPEVYVGRAPVVTVAEAQRFVNKTFQYARTPVGDYEHTAMFFAEVLFPQNWSPGMATSLDGAELVEEVLPSLQAVPGTHYLRLYENHLDPRWQPGALLETRATVIDSMNVGYNMAVHVGHGYRNVMSVGDNNLENGHALGLTNGSRLTNLYAINCTSNAIDFPCIGEAFLHAAGGGAVTNIGSTRFDFPHAGRVFQKEYMKLMYELGTTAVGEAQAGQKIPFVGFSTSDNINRWTMTTLLMLGDPELRQWTAQPRTLALGYPGSFALNDTSMTVNVMAGGLPLAGARVTLYKPGDDYRSATTDGAGNATVDFRPGSTGTFYLTVTGFNCRTRQDTLTVGPAGPAALAHLAPVIDDDAVGGTSGNGNGILDAGEIVDLQIPIINRGGGTATAVNGVLSTTDGMVTIVTPSVSYGTIAALATSNGTAAYRVSVPYTLPDQREIPFQLDLVDMEGRHYLRRLAVTARAPEPWHVGHTLTDSPGNGDGVPEPGETITMLAGLRNLGTGTAGGVSVVLRNYDGLATVTDSSAIFGTLAPGQEVQGDPLVYDVVSTSARLELRISNEHGLLTTKTLDLAAPNAPISLAAVGSQSSIALSWARSGATDLAGYNVYRSTAIGGPYSKVNAVPTDRTSYYRDEGLAPLTPYFYKVAAVDSSGNESVQSAITSTSTNPPHHNLFPVEMRRATPASVAIDRMYLPSGMDIAAGADVLWLWHADGSAPVDADGTAVSHGDFTKLGTYYAAGPSLAKLDGINWNVIGGSWRTAAPESLLIYVFDTQGAVRPGWPFRAADGIFSGIAVGDLNNDGSKELVFGSNGTRFYVLRDDGTEWMDGDANPATQGVFKVLGACCNYGTPALADLDNNGELDILFAAFDGKLYGWRPSGASLPGFPVTLGGSVTSSVAVGYLDGAGDTQLEVVITSPNDSLYVIKSDGGRRAGFPVYVRLGGTTKNPSPALADMDADGFTDIVVAGTDGRIRVYDRNGVLHANFTNARYSTLTNFASESSPAVGDIDGDGLPDVVMGDENGMLNAISGTGQVMPGFPIQLGGEVRGSPAVCDCDFDGKSEIVVSSWDQKTYMWDYDFPFSPGGPPPWPQFHHDAARTGLASNPVFLDAPQPGLPAVPAAVQLGPPRPNPARGVTRIHWVIPAARVGEDLDLSVYDLSGRRVATLASGRALEGRFAVDWDLRAEESGAGRVGAGIYFLRFRVGAISTSRKLVVMP